MSSRRGVNQCVQVRDLCLLTFLRFFVRSVRSIILSYVHSLTKRGFRCDSGKLNVMAPCAVSARSTAVG